MNQQLFFTEVAKDLPKNAKIAIDGLERVTPSRKYSHNAAWVRLHKNMIESAGWKDVTILKKDDTYEEYDALIISLGISFNGNINFFFGLDDNVCWRFKRIQDFDGPIFVMNHDMPMIGSTVNKRLNNKSTSSQVNQLKPDLLDKICHTIKRFDYVEKTKNLCFGDSHCFSTYVEGQMICRSDGLTLFSTLRDGVEEVITRRSGLKLTEIDSLTFYMGNIDIRHHLMRQPDAIERCQYMVMELGRQLKKTGIKNIEIVQVLPIENTERKLPKSGYYKGTPYYGSWEERTKLVNTFNRGLDRISIENNFKIFRWPYWFLNENKELDFEYMERPKSVHISPLAYRWNIFSNEFNDLHINKE